jgi:hypothetical protein
MAPGRFLLSLFIVVVFALGGFGFMQWLQSAPTPIAVASAPTIPGTVVINRLEGCDGFNQSIDEAIALQNRIGHPHNSARLAGLKRDCRNDPQEHYRVVPR